MFIVVLVAILFTSIQLVAQQNFTPADPEYYAMDREDMTFDDEQVILVNYRGFVSPRQYSVTQFTNVMFLPFAAPRYEFNLNFFDKIEVKPFSLEKCSIFIFSVVVSWNNQIEIRISS